MLARYRKAIAAVLTPIVTLAVGWLILKTKLDVDPDTVIVLDTAVSAALTGWIVKQVPNDP